MSTTFGARAKQGVMRRRQKHLTATQKKEVKSLITRRLESDYYDNGVLATSLTNTATIQSGFSTPAQGVSDGQRVGDKINLRSFNFRFNIVAADSTQMIRIILFRWHDNDTTAPTAAQVLQSPVSFPIISNINHDSLKKGQIHVMYDQTFAMATSAGSPINIFRDVKISGKKLGRKGIEYNNGAVTGCNNIYALFQSDSVAVTHPVINWYSRLIYDDA